MTLDNFTMLVYFFDKKKKKSDDFMFIFCVFCFLFFKKFTSYHLQLFLILFSEIVF